MSLKERVSKGSLVKFKCYSNNELWYICNDGFEFPVPISDTNDAEFKNEDKAILFMRWINNHMILISSAKAE
jgi:hypothetical protein